MSNITLTKDEALQNIKDLQEYIEQLEENKTVVWTPKLGEFYYFIDEDGDILQGKNTDYSVDKWNIEIGNCFKTSEEAERYKMRIKSMKKIYLPKMGENYWIPAMNRSEKVLIPNCITWEGLATNWVSFHIGMASRTESECEEWIKTYGNYWIGE